MTTPSYPFGWPAKLQVGAEAWSSDHAWIVSFNNGNANNNHRDNNNAFVRAVRASPSGECQGAGAQGIPLRALYNAWRAARRGKKPSRNQLAFDMQWADRLLQLQREVNAGRWQPRPSTCFIATRPKAREIHAPDFGDRVVHHWLVPQLEAVYEPRFIFDSYANRRGKGSHAAVRRLQCFVRQVASGQGGGYYLQLDIHNYFNSIHRATLWRLLKPVLMRAGVSHQALQATHALLRRDRKQLVAWQRQIEQFLAQRLRLSLKADVKLRPLGDGIDFLGYVIRPTHTLARRRVVAHACEAFAAWEARHVHNGHICATPSALRALQATAASYAGHLKHASCHRLQNALHRRFAWLAIAATPRRFPARQEGRAVTLRFKEVDHD